MALDRSRRTSTAVTLTLADRHEQHVAESADKVSNAPDTRRQTVVLREPDVQLVALTLLTEQLAIREEHPTCRGRSAGRCRCHSQLNAFERGDTRIGFVVCTREQDSTRLPLRAMLVDVERRAVFRDASGNAPLRLGLTSIVVTEIAIVEQRCSA